MKYRQLGQSELKVSEISFGCWTMGGLNWIDGSPNGWAEVDEDEILAGVKAGLDKGMNHFDNADAYGNGRAERMLAKVLKRLGVHSEDVIIASKMGHFSGSAEHAYEPAHIRHQCEQSLINLKRDYLDIYYFHHGNFGPEDRYLPEAIEAMDKLVAEGKIRVKGLSAYSTEDFVRLVPTIKPTVLQSWAYADDDQFIRSGSGLQKLMAKYHLSFVAFSPLGQGRLLGKYSAKNPPQFEPGDFRRDNEHFKSESLAALEPKLEKLKERFGSTAEALASVALNYVLSHEHVACVIPGFRNEKQAHCNLGASQGDLSEEDVAFVRDLFSDK